MGSGLIWRRAATAAGLWGSALLGVLATVLATRILGSPERFGVFATVMAAAGFFQMLLDLTVEEALTKYGFRYLERGAHGRLHRLFRTALLAKIGGGALSIVALLALAPFADRLFDGDGLGPYLAIVCVLPFLQSPESVASTALILAGRYDHRALFLSVSMGLRLAGVSIGALYGIGWALAGAVIAQALATAAISVAGLRAYRRLPAAPPSPLAEDVPELRSFVVQSSLSTGVVAIRQSLAPLLLGAVGGTREVGLLRVAQAPQAGFAALTGPVRLTLLAEQTPAWEAGRKADVMRGVSRYMVAATAFCAVTVPLFYVFMPDLVRVVFGEKFTGATPAARIVLFAAAAQLVLGWTKSFAVTVGRPRFRVVAHAVEAAVLLPLTVVLGAHSGVEGAAWAILASVLAFAAVWVVLLLRVRREVRDEAATGLSGALR